MLDEPGSTMAMSQRFVNQIKRGDYIDFDSLHSSLFGLDPDSQQQRAFSFEGEGEESPFTIRIPNQARPKNEVNNFMAWLKTWNVYMNTYCQFFPEMTNQLMTYQTTIYPTECWMAYDRFFRLTVAANRRLRRDKWNEDMYNTHIRLKLATLTTSVSRSVRDTLQPTRQHNQ